MAITLVRKPGTPGRPEGSTPPFPKLLTVRDAAALGKVSTQTVRRLIKAGELKAYRVGRQIRIDEADLIANIRPQELKW